MYRQFSPNMLKTFELCPRKFYYKYTKNINMPVNDEIFEFGKNIHALASYYLKKENIDKMETALSAKEDEVWQYLKASKYFGYEVIGTEYTLTVKIDNFYFSGRLDALVKNGDKYYILDYKTGSVPKDAKYDFQTMIYLLAVKEFFKTNDVTFIYLDLKNKDELKIELSVESEKKYREKLLNTAKKITLSDVPAKNRMECNCEYDKICY